MITIRARFSGKGLQLIDPVPVRRQCDALVTFLDPGMFSRRKSEAAGEKKLAARLRFIHSARGAYKSKRCTSQAFMRRKNEEKRLEQ